MSRTILGNGRGAAEAVQQASHFLNLSEELIVYIFSFCDVQELVCEANYILLASVAFVLSMNFHPVTPLLLHSRTGSATCAGGSTGFATTIPCGEARSSPDLVTLIFHYLGMHAYILRTRVGLL